MVNEIAFIQFQNEILKLLVVKVPDPQKNDFLLWFIQAHSDTIRDIFYKIESLKDENV